MPDALGHLDQGANANRVGTSSDWTRKAICGKLRGRTDEYSKTNLHPAAGPPPNFRQHLLIAGPDVDDPDSAAHPFTARERPVSSGGYPFESMNEGR